MRRTVLARALAVLLLPALAGCGEAQSTPPPSGTARVVGGGATPLAAVEGAAAATAVAARGITAMTVAPDGTIWLVHEAGRVFRARARGELAPVPASGAPLLGETVAVTVDVGAGALLLTDGSHAVSRLDAGRWSRFEIAGLPARAVLTGIAAARDGTVFVADGMTGVVYRAAPGRRAQAVAGTPDGGCRRIRYRPPYPIGLAGSGAGLVVADPACELYRPAGGVIAQTPDCLDGPDAAAFPVAVSALGARDLVVGGRFCELVWRVPVTGGGPVEIAGRDVLDGPPRAVGADHEGVVYVLDDAGVLASPRGAARGSR